MFLWILIFIFGWILMPIHSQIEGAKGKKKIGKSIKGVTKTVTKGVSKAANKVGSSVAKIATAGLGPDATKVLKNMRVIKRAIGSFIKKTGNVVTSGPPEKVDFVARKCGIQ